MWNKIKKVLVYILIGILAVFIFIVWRRHSHGGSVPGIDDIIGLIGGGTEQLAGGLENSTGLNQQASELAGQASGAVESAAGHCVTARQAIRRAKDILLRAKAGGSEK